jgi:hypothetical protein
VNGKEILEHVDYLHSELSGNQAELDENLSYFEATRRLKSLGVSVPEEMRVLSASVGWPAQYIRALIGRLRLEGFRMGGAAKTDERLWGWWKDNRLRSRSRQLHTEVQMHGRGYVSLAAPDPEDRMANPESPLIRPESPKNVWAETDPVTGRITEALRVYKAKRKAATPAATLLLPDATVFLRKPREDGKWVIYGKPVEHGLGMVPMVEFLNNPGLHDLAGRSAITQPLRDQTDTASRLFMTMSATAELMGVPQRLLFGVAEDALRANPDDPGSVLEAYLAKIITVENPDASAFQFLAAELRNFVEGLQEVTRFAAAETGLPPQYMSLTSDNPASADAIRASQDRLISQAEELQDDLGDGWEQVMRVGLLVMDRGIPDEARRMESVWRNAATPTLSAKADAVTKLVATATQDGKQLVPTERARIDLGYSPEEREEMERWDRDSPTGVLAGLTRPAFQEPGAPAGNDNTKGREAA